MTPIELSTRAAARHPRLVEYLQTLSAPKREEHLIVVLRCLQLGIREQLTGYRDLEDFCLIATGFRAGYLPPAQDASQLH